MTANLHTRSHTALVADVGGTNARFAIADLNTLLITGSARFRRAEFPSLLAAIRYYLDGVEDPPTAAALAIAAPIIGATVHFTNSPWLVDIEELRSSLGLDPFLILNDFEALAHALPHLRPSDLYQIGGSTPVDRATRVVLGPGTGLGIASLFWGGTGWLAMASEGGHSSFAAEDAREFAILERLLIGQERVSVERLVSGPGLAAVYRIIAELDGRSVPRLEAPEVVERALAREDSVAQETLMRFTTWLGRFAGDAALFFAARGGVYLGGGIAPRIVDVLSSGGFRRAFELKGRMAPYVAPLPCYVITSHEAGLIGAAVALAGQPPAATA
ncbi:MAG: glucokinase [Hyphomicrobiaceae bacterium]